MSDPREFKISIWLEGNVKNMEEKQILTKVILRLSENLVTEISQPQSHRILSTSEELSYTTGLTKLKFHLLFSPDFERLIITKTASRQT